MNIDDRQTVITIVYAKTERLRRIIGKCIRATEREFPDDRKLLGIDQGSPELERYAAAHGWTLVYPGPGEPPRMGSILRACVEHVTTEVLWTIEHDAQVLQGRRNELTEILAEHDDIAGIDCLTVGANGKPTYPGVYHLENAPYPGDSRILSNSRQGNLNCGIWRLAAWAAVDWRDVPEFPAVDRVVTRQMMAAGWKVCIAPKLTCVHHVARARRHLPKKYWRG